MQSPQFTFGPTLARATSGANARAHIRDAHSAGKVKASVTVAVCSTANPLYMNVDASVHGMTPAEALDALAITAARISALHGIPASTVPALTATDADQLEVVAARLVDRIRSVGWWETAANWVGMGAQFKYTREAMVRELAREMGRRRPEVAVEKAARGHSAYVAAADDIPGVKSRTGEAA